MRRHLLFVLLAGGMACCLWSLTMAAESNEARVWTDSTGKFKIEAVFEKFEGGKVHLRRTDNDQLIAVPSGKLSKDDQAIVRKMLAQRNKSNRATNVVASSAASKAKAPATGMRSWQGTWNNRKYGTSGPLICTASAKDDKTWNATFDGEGLGKPFQYKVTISATQKGEQTLLQGVSSVDGDTYRWTGNVRGNVLYGRYRSAQGNNGEFQLREMAVKQATSR